MSKRNKAIEEAMEEEIKLELTPMIDISFLIIIFFMCLPFKTLEGKLQAFLPTDKGINPIPLDPPNEIKIQVHIVPRAFKPRGWGPPDKAGKHPYTVDMPTQVRFRFQGKETEDIADVAAYIREAKATAAGSESTKVKGEIKAGHRVPHKFVIAVLNQFADARLTEVDFFGTKIPGPKVRQSQLLPYPKSDYVGMEGN